MSTEADFELWHGQSPLDLVADFNQAFAPDHLTDQVIDPTILASDVARARCEFIQEEVDEMWEAYRNNDPVAFVDAIVDLQYFLYGTALALGIPLEEAFLEVHESNMAKRNADGTVTRNELGKVQKPEGWQAPDLGKVLAWARMRGSPFPTVDEMPLAA